MERGEIGGLGVLFGSDSSQNGLPHSGSFMYFATSAGSRLSQSKPGLSENGLLKLANTPAKISDGSSGAPIAAASSALSTSSGAGGP